MATRQFRRRALRGCSIRVNGVLTSFATISTRPDNAYVNVKFTSIAGAVDPFVVPVNTGSWARIIEYVQRIL